ncbi:hypothetical protein Dimus_024902 [Dionaea muscipula]
MSVIHLKKKDVVKSKVRGVEIQFDHEKLATILGIPGNNGILIDEATVEGESGSGEKFYDAEDKDQSSPEVQEEIPAATPQSSARRREQGTSESTLVSYCGIPEDVMTKLQAEFERKRANRFLADLEKAKAENARLLALLHQAQSKSNP